MRARLVVNVSSLGGIALAMILSLTSVCTPASQGDSNEEYQLMQMRERFSQAFVLMQDRKFQNHEAFQIVVEYPSLVVNYLASRKTPNSQVALVSLTMFRLDGALAEDHTCAVLSLHLSAKPAIARVQGQDLRKICLALAAKLGLSDVALCAAEGVTKQRLATLYKGAASGKDCSK